MDLSFNLSSLNIVGTENLVMNKNEQIQYEKTDTK